MPESLHSTKLEPFRTFCVLDFHSYSFTNRVSTTPYYHHSWTHKEGGLLLAWNWCICIAFLRRFNPIPSSITVSSQTPGIIESTLIHMSATKDNHHAVSTSSWAYASWVLYPRAWTFISCFYLCPREWCFLYVKTPHISHWLTPCVSAEYQEVGSSEHYGVPISASRGLSHNRNYHPVGNFFSLPQIQEKQIITC